MNNDLTNAEMTGWRQFDSKSNHQVDLISDTNNSTNISEYRMDITKTLRTFIATDRREVSLQCRLE
jgi:hypothetical protein